MRHRVTRNPVTRLLPILLILFAETGTATVPLDGRLLAGQDCPLYQSIKKGTNPDGARLVPGRTYPVLGKNKEDASHYRVRADGAAPAERWVEVGCGTLVGTSPAADPSASAPREDQRRGPSSVGDRPADTRVADEPSTAGRFVLAASWHPAFCEIRSRRPECRGEASDAEDSEGLAFSLHGLWPQPGDNVFCGVSEVQRGLAERGPWSRLPALDLRSSTRVRLETVMPGSRSHLHRYEWTKHGTCYGTSPDAYYRHAIVLLEQLNASAVRTLFTRHVGRHVSARDIRGAFDSSFGRGVGERVRVRCSDGMISELQIGLRGRVSESSSLARLIEGAQRRSVGCRGGRVDAPGPGD